MCVIVIDTSEAKNELQVFINPEILWPRRKVECEEGVCRCPASMTPSRAPERVRVKAFDVQDSRSKRESSGLLAVCIQHEMDHLLARSSSRYCPPLKQERIKRRMKEAAHPRRLSPVTPVCYARRPATDRRVLQPMTCAVIMSAIFDCSAGGKSWPIPGISSSLAPRMCRAVSMPAPAAAADRPGRGHQRRCG